MSIENITVNGSEFEVEYNILGKYMPATQYEPEEFPEIEITKIQGVGDIFNAINAGTCYEDIYSKLNEVLNEKE